MRKKKPRKLEILTVKTLKLHTRVTQSKQRKSPHIDLTPMEEAFLRAAVKAAVARGVKVSEDDVSAARQLGLM